MPSRNATIAFAVVAVFMVVMSLGGLSSENERIIASPDAMRKSELQQQAEEQVLHQQQQQQQHSPSNHHDEARHVGEGAIDRPVVEEKKPLPPPPPPRRETARTQASPEYHAADHNEDHHGGQDDHHAAGDKWAGKPWLPPANPTAAPPRRQEILDHETSAPLPNDNGETNDSPSLSKRIQAWTGLPSLTHSDLPIHDSGRIPKRVWTTWKEKKLGKNALRYWQNWLNNEHDKEFIVITDDECSQLAGLYPGFKPYFDKIPLVVMKADICRVLAVYFFGGYYKDLDVDHRKPLSQFVDDRDGIVYGWEDDEHMCQWFFAARPGDPCLRNILQHIVNVVSNTSAIDFKTNIEAVIDLTGPGVWTDALQGCPFPPKYSVHQMKFDHIYHDYASQRWNGPQYKSWLDDRKEKAGWKAQWPSFENAKHFTSPQESHLMPIREDMPPIEIAQARASSSRQGLASLHGPQLAFDGTMDTAYESNDREHAWFSVEFAEPMVVGTVFNAEDEGPEHLAGIRMFNRHREPGFGDHGKHNLYIELYDENGKHFFTVRKQSRLASVFIWYFAGMKNKVKKLIIKKAQPGVLTFSELQLFSDPPCLKARSVRLNGADPTISPSLPRAVRLASTITARCPSARGISPAMGFQYTHCGPVPSQESGCQSYVVADHRAEIDAGFADAMNKAGCPLRPVSNGEIKLSGNAPSNLMRDAISEDFCDGRCFTAKRFHQVTAADGTDAPTLLYVDHTKAEWTRASEESILRMAAELKARTLFLPLRINSEALKSETMVTLLETLLETYDVHAFHINPGEGFFSFEGMDFPSELHLSLSAKRA